MRKSHKIALLVLSHLVLAGLGFFGGLVAGTSKIKEDYRQEQLAAGGWLMLAWYSDYTRMLGQDGDAARYLDTLVDFDSTLEQRRDSGDPPISETMYRTWRMLNNTRLSLLKAKLGDPESAWRHIGVAADACATMSWSDCTPDALVAFAKRVEGF
jgi:hypothetical protein